MTINKNPDDFPLDPHKRAVVIGASSGIGAALAKKLVVEGYAVAVLGRREDTLRELADKLNRRYGEQRVWVYAHDVANTAEVPSLFQNILRDLKNIDTVAYVAGAHPTITPDEYNTEKDLLMLNTNLLGAVAWLNEAAVLFERMGNGQIVGVSSVAGDRGRVGNPVYNTSKAGLSTYLEALRNRLNRKGVNVLTVKPGPVDTAILREHQPKGGGLPVAQAADLILSSDETTTAGGVCAVDVALDYDGDSPYPLDYIQEIEDLMADQQSMKLIPRERLFRVENFGHSFGGPAYVYRPTNLEQIADVFELAREQGVSVGLRGAGRSYGDAATNRGQIILDLQRMNRVLDYNPETGVIRVQSGYTFENLWQYTLEDGWWSPVMPGTMKPTIGGALGSNVHGKNNWKQGTLGEHVLSFDAMMLNGEILTCTPKKNKNLFYAMIGGMGMLGVFTSITLQLKKIYSGDLRVRAWSEPTYDRILQATDEEKENDYIVGWVDTTARGYRLGRGQMHSANYLAEGEDPNPAQSLHLNNQALPPNIMGVVPRSMVWQILRLGMNVPGAWVGNTAKYWLNRLTDHNKESLQGFIPFNFLLDYVPNWERAYGRGGMIQLQTFLPKETALEAHTEILQLAQRRWYPPFLGVVKRHRPDSFLLSHAVDGFSLALDFKVSPRRMGTLRSLTKEINYIAAEAGGRFYFAKDSTLTAKVVTQYLGEDTVKKFKALKKKHDPENILQTDLYRRCFCE